MVWTTQTSAWSSRCTPAVSTTRDINRQRCPWLTCVSWVQLGLPMEKAQYIHRLGRTARAGKSGKGLIILGESVSHCLAMTQLGFCHAARH